MTTEEIISFVIGAVVGLIIVACVQRCESIGWYGIDDEDDFL